MGSFSSALYTTTALHIMRRKSHIWGFLELYKLAFRALSFRNAQVAKDQKLFILRQTLDRSTSYVFALFLRKRAELDYTMFVPTGMSPAPSTTGVLRGSSEDLTGHTTGPSGCKFNLLSQSARSRCGQV